jgi:hypothetical protein
VKTDASISSDAAGVADAVLLEPSIAEQAATITSGIWGIDDSDGHKTGALPGGTDFLVISPESEVAALRAEEVAKLIRLDLAAPDSVLQAVSTLPIEAVLVDAPAKGSLKVADLLDYLRVGAMVRRPIILPVAADFVLEQLVALRDSGVAAVLFEVKNPGDLEKLKQMRTAIDEFPEPPRRDRNRDSVVPSLPAVQMPQPHTHDDDEDDD